MPAQMKDRILKSPSPPSLEPGTILLQTERLMIRRYLPSDAPEMTSAADHSAIFDCLRDRVPCPYTLADAESWIAIQTSQKSAYPGSAGIFLKQNGSASEEAGQGHTILIGSIGMEPKDDVEYRTWEVGYWLTPSAWGKGYATEAVNAFVRWAFLTWPRLNRVEAHVLTWNHGSAGVLNKCGFTREGLRRECAEKGGVVAGHIMFGLLRSDLDL